jgi:hypothetical protein
LERRVACALVEHNGLIEATHSLARDRHQVHRVCDTRRIAGGLGTRDCGLETIERCLELRLVYVGARDATEKQCGPFGLRVRTKLKRCLVSCTRFVASKLALELFGFGDQ